MNLGLHDQLAHHSVATCWIDDLAGIGFLSLPSMAPQNEEQCSTGDGLLRAYPK